MPGLAEQQYWQRTAGAELPMWLMTSHATDEAVREALGDRIDGDRVAVFSQQAASLGSILPGACSVTATAAPACTPPAETSATPLPRAAC